MKATKSIIKVKVKEISNLVSKLKAFKKELNQEQQGHPRRTILRENFKNGETQELLTLGESTIIEQVSNN